MGPRLMAGRACAAELKQELTSEVKELTALRRQRALATVLVGRGYAALVLSEECAA